MFWRDVFGFVKAIGLLIVVGVVLLFAMVGASAAYHQYSHKVIPMGDVAVIWGTYPDGSPIIPQSCGVEVTKVGRSVYRVRVRDASQDGFELEMRVNTGFVMYPWEEFEGRRLVYRPWRSEDGLTFEPNFDLKPLVQEGKR